MHRSTSACEDPGSRYNPGLPSCEQVDVEKGYYTSVLAKMSGSSYCLANRKVISQMWQLPLHFQAAPNTFSII